MEKQGIKQKSWMFFTLKTKIQRQTTKLSMTPPAILEAIATHRASQSALSAGTPEEDASQGHSDDHALRRDGQQDEEDDRRRLCPKGLDCHCLKSRN